MWGGQGNGTPRSLSPPCPPKNSSLSPTRLGGPAMTLDDILASLFPNGHDVRNNDGLLQGSGSLKNGRRAEVIGVTGRTAVGVEEAIRLSGQVLDAVNRG